MTSASIKNGIGLLDFLPKEKNRVLCVKQVKVTEIRLFYRNMTKEFSVSSYIIGADVDREYESLLDKKKQLFSWTQCETIVAYELVKMRIFKTIPTTTISIYFKLTLNR